MKKTIGSAILIFLTLTAVACANGQSLDGKARPDQNEKAVLGLQQQKSFSGLADVAMVAKELRITGTAIELEATWSNDSDIDLMFGEYFTVDKKTAAGWEQLGEDGFFRSIGYPIAAHSKSNHIYPISIYTGTLERGIYRIKTNFINSREPGDFDEYPLIMEFSYTDKNDTALKLSEEKVYVFSTTP